MNPQDREPDRGGPPRETSVRTTVFRRLNFRITLLLVISFILIVALFLSILVPFQQKQLRRFIDDRRKFLDFLVEARLGDICHWWIQESVEAHWQEFQKIILAHPNIRHATLYYRDKPLGARAAGQTATERLVVTSDPALVQREREAALEAGVQLRPHPAARGRAGAPLLAAVGGKLRGKLWLRSADGEGYWADLGSFRTEAAPLSVQEVGVDAEHSTRVDGGERVLQYTALVYTGHPDRGTFQRIGHLCIEYSLAELDVQESSIRSLFYGLLGALFLVLLGLLNISLGRSVVTPIRKVLDAMRQAGAGDLDVRLERRGPDEIGIMADRFNQMVQDLQRSKVAIEEYSRTLEQRVKDRTAKLMQSEQRARELKDHLSAVLRHVQAGVFALDADGRIVTFNERSGELLGLEPTRVLDRPAREVLGSTALEALGRMVVDEVEGRSSIGEEVKLGPPGKARTFRVAVTSLEGGGKVVVLDDVTDLIYSKRLLAWREAVERVIHDIKNPLTPVRLSAQQIRVAYDDGSPDLETIVDKGTANILSSVDHLQNMLADFSLLYRRPRAEPRPVNVNALVEKVLDEQAPAVAEGVRLVKTLAPGLPTVMGDPLGLWRLVTNVVQNGLEAMRGHAGEFSVATERTDEGVRLTVVDQGPGIPPDRLDKLFEPYFTTKAKGTGLGLVIARQIVEDHGGVIEIQSVVGKGTVARIELPLGNAVRSSDDSSDS